MKMTFYKPKNEILQKYLEGYYFISEDENFSAIRYKTFPNNYSIFSVAQNVDIFYEENKIKIIPSSEEKISTDLVLRYNYPIDIVYKTSVNEITIYFKPLGLNQFINDSEFFTKQKSVSNYVPFFGFNEKMKEIFSLENREKQIEKLENYWLSKLQIKDFSLMERILFDVESDLRMKEIAEKHNFTRQYINKIFLKHIGKSPAEYRKIYRFRKLLAKKRESKNLTELSYDNLFYDQSHFNKDFKDLTDIKPSSFFKNVDVEKENIWLFI